MISTGMQLIQKVSKLYLKSIIYFFSNLIYLLIMIKLIFSLVERDHLMMLTVGHAIKLFILILGAFYKFLSFIKLYLKFFIT